MRMPWLKPQTKPANGLAKPKREMFIDDTVPSHTHEISFGIYTGTTARSAAIKVDGNTIPTVSDYQNIDIAPYLDCDANGKITRNTWHEIAIYPDALTRIAASVFTQLFTNSRGSGDY